MAMKLTFGWHLDGPHYPEESGLGELVVGPIGMINQLAMRLGLFARLPARAVRITEFVRRLHAIDTGEHFYSRSFKTDPWGTARALLHLRDELVAAGWRAENENLNGVNAHGQPSERIRTLAVLETRCADSANGNLACLTDLCAAIAEKLENGAKVPFDEVRLVDSEESLPPIWWRIFSALRISGVVVGQLSIGDSLNRDTDIARLCELISGAEVGASNGAPLKLTGDGSLTVVEADDEVQAADLAAEILKCLHSSSEPHVVIRGGSTSFLDRLLQRANLPSLGGADSSAQRGFLSIIPLALKLCWSPVNPTDIIEFLMLPNSPVPRFAASCFIKALRQEPGIGSASWEGAWAKALERKRKTYETSAEKLDEASIEEQVKLAEADWKQWLATPLFSPSNGMPTSYVVSLCRRIRAHALARFGVFGEEVFGRTAAYADILAQSVEAWPEKNIPAAQLDRMIESVLDDGYSLAEPEASSWTPIDQPGQIFGCTTTVLWWGFVSGARHAKSTPWTSAELEYLQKKENVLIENPNAATTRDALSWRRPLFAAGRLILMKPRTVAGQTAAAHPFFHEILEHIESASPEARALIVKQAHQIYSHPEIDIAGNTIVRSESRAGKLPAARPIWKVSPGTLTAREESPSSLERLLSCPMSWMLRYKAHINRSDILSIPEGEQLAGNLAHAVFAKILTPGIPISHEGIEELAESVFDDLCPKVAAPLLLHGHSLERQRLRKAICEGAAHLVSMLNQAGFSSVECESARKQVIEDIGFVGQPDMVLRHPDDNSDFVLDLKWTKREQYRRREISEGHAVQLAVYATLARCDSEIPTHAGYYMIKQKLLLSTSPAAFPSHSFVSGPSLDETFKRILSNYKLHMQYLLDGTVYATGVEHAYDAPSPTAVVVDQEPLVPGEVPGITLCLEPPCRICHYGRICGQKGYLQ